MKRFAYKTLIRLLEGIRRNSYLIQHELDKMYTPPKGFEFKFKSSCCNKPIVVGGEPGMCSVKCSKCKKECLIR